MRQEQKLFDTDAEEEDSLNCMGDIQEKTSYHLSKLFDYFWEEDQEKII